MDGLEWKKRIKIDDLGVALIWETSICCCTTARVHDFTWLLYMLYTGDMITEAKTTPKTAPGSDL